MRILFIGSVEFSLKALQKLVDINANIVGVCTKESSNFNSDFANLAPICKSNSIPCIYVKNINSEQNINWVKELKPDIIFCFGWSSLIKKELLDLPPMGIIGFHPANIPQNRGRHPLIWALVLGLEESASTFFFMEEGADDGDILSQEKFDILYKDDAQTVYNRVVNVALNQIEIFLYQLESKTFTRLKQNHKLANTWRKRDIKDGQIDFRMDSFAVYNLVRGLSKPYIGAHIKYKDKDIKVWKVEEIDCREKNIEPGKVITHDNNTIIVKCNKNAVKILKHEFNNLPKLGEYL
ncbi:MAG: methionyl-tRNA formyltransferase [Bacteroidetes bacterium]|nr:methionyl-tRNA formyltransferase [Bacteroidota bacterium]